MTRESTRHPPRLRLLFIFLALARTAALTLSDCTRLVPAAHSTSSAAIDASGNIYVLESANNRAVKYTPGSSTSVTVAGGNGGGTGGNQLRNPWSVLLLDGDLIIADFSNNRIMRWTPGAAFGTRWGPALNFRPAEMSLTDDNELLTATVDGGDFGSTVWKISTDGTLTGMPRTSSASLAIKAFDRDPLGNILFVAASSTSIYNYTDAVPVLTSDKIVEPKSLRIDPLGQVWIGMRNNGGILRCNIGLGTCEECLANEVVQVETLLFDAANTNLFSFLAYDEGLWQCPTPVTTTRTSTSSSSSSTSTGTSTSSSSSTATTTTSCSSTTSSSSSTTSSSSTSTVTSSTSSTSTVTSSSSTSSSSTSSSTMTSTSTVTSSSTTTSSSSTSSSTSGTSSSTTTTSTSLSTTTSSSTSTSVSATSTSSSTSATSTSTRSTSTTSTSTVTTTLSSTSTTSTSTGTTTLSTSTTTTTSTATTTTVTSTSSSSSTVTTSTSTPTTATTSTTSTTSTMSTSLTTSTRTSTNTPSSSASSTTSSTTASGTSSTTSSMTSTSSSTHTSTSTASRRTSTTSTTTSTTSTGSYSSTALTSTSTTSSGTAASASASTSPTAPTRAPRLAEVLEPVANVSSDLLVRLQGSEEDRASASIPGGSLTALRLDTLEQLTNWSGNGDGDGDGSAANSSGGIDITITISLGKQAEDETETKAVTVDMKMTLPQELFQALPASSAPGDSVALLVSTFSSESADRLAGQRGQEPGSGQVVDLQVLSVASIELTYMLSGENLEVQGLEKPIIFQLPGTNYSTASLCAYWQEDTQLWSFEGVDTPEDGNTPGQLMVCHTKHLSVFGAIMRSVSTSTTTTSGTVMASTSGQGATMSTSTAGTVSTSEGGVVPTTTTTTTLATANNDNKAPTPAPASAPTPSEPPNAAEVAADLLDSVAKASADALAQLRLQGSGQAAVSIPGGSLTAVRLDTTNSSGESITVSVAGVEGTMAITLPWEVFKGVPASPVPGDSLALVVASFLKQSAGGLGGQQNEEDSGQVAELQVASVISLDLHYILVGDAVEVQRLQDPIVFEMPGANYTASTLCAYWEGTRQLWSFDGVATPGDNSPGQPLICHTYHLSFFAAILQSFVLTLKCAQFNLLSSEAIKNLFSDTPWLTSPGAWMCWSVYAGLALAFGLATLTDWKRDQRQCWRDEFFLVATAENGPEGGAPGAGVSDGRMDLEDSRAFPTEGEGEGKGEGGGVPLHSLVLQLALQGGSICLQCLWGSTALRDATDEIMGSWCEYWGDIRGAIETFCEVVGQGAAGGSWSDLGHRVGGMLLLASSRRLAAASMGMTNEAVTFVLEDEDLQDYLTETPTNEPVGTRAQDWKTSEDQRVAWMSLHDHVVHHVLDHTGRHTACRLPRVAAEFFVFHNPVSGLFMQDIFHSCKKRVLLLAVDLLGSMAMSVVFFESVGMVRGKPIQTGDDCGGDSSLAGMIGRLLAIATGSLIVSGFPLTLIDSLHTKSFRKLDYRGSEAWKKQLRIWATQDRMVWALSLLYVGFCAFFVLVFVASVGPTDHKSWTQAGILVVIEDFVMIPAFLAFTVPALTAVFLEVLRSLQGSDHASVLRQSQESLLQHTSVMNPITRI